MHQSKQIQLPLLITEVINSLILQAGRFLSISHATQHSYCLYNKNCMYNKKFIKISDGPCVPCDGMFRGQRYKLFQDMLISAPFILLKFLFICPQTRKAADWLSKEMTKQGHAVALLSGDLDMQQRHDVIERFRDGKEKVLITTNVSSRGRLLLAFYLCGAVK